MVCITWGSMSLLFGSLISASLKIVNLAFSDYAVDASTFHYRQLFEDSIIIAIISAIAIIWTVAAMVSCREVVLRVNKRVTLFSILVSIYIFSPWVYYVMRKMYHKFWLFL